MTYSLGKYGEVQVGGVQSTVVGLETTASFAYELYKEKKEQILKLEYECELLVDKYHAEMCKAETPPQFREDVMDDMFGKDGRRKKFAREYFLDKGFSEGFLKRHKVEFVDSWKSGYSHTSFGVILGIGDYEYTIEIPLPGNIRKKEDKERLMGGVKFRVDRLHKSKKNDFCKTMESVRMPTYDWKACFEAIEADVERPPAGQEAE